MLTAICQYLKNWFNRKPDGTDYPKQSGTFSIVDGALESEILTDEQYFRIMGSLFNDGVHKVGESLKDEKFSGEIWSMGVPPEIVSLAEDITAWQEKYGAIDNPAMSPYQSESFGGYSYSKQQGSSSSGGTMLNTWQSAFAERLSQWRKI